ncbi:hypothetical protein ACQPXB_26575 [Amycolatopsis sp. CA-161197]|uniref:hypothetical protein n=1 Tax=Amycolatopsis sp. CA-161197 TaxID=3239922 RepID=UPI003D8C6C36
MSTTHHGEADERFGAVADAFARNFADFPELGAAVTVFVGGRKVVELWGGVADEATDACGNAKPWCRFSPVPKRS